MSGRRAVVSIVVMVLALVGAVYTLYALQHRQDVHQEQQDRATALGARRGCLLVNSDRRDLAALARWSEQGERDAFVRQHLGGVAVSLEIRSERDCVAAYPLP